MNDVMLRQLVKKAWSNLDKASDALKSIQREMDREKYKDDIKRLEAKR